MLEIIVAAFLFAIGLVLGFILGYAVRAHMSARRRRRRYN
jgi:hypothetical protein